MKAVNFKEGYDYCNKALEVDPTSSEIWENKAICSFWLSTKREVFSTQAKEIVTYLNTARSYDSNSKTLPITSKNIAWDLYSLGYIWIHTTSKMENGGYLWADIEKLFEYIKLWDTAFDIHNETQFLKDAVKEFSVAEGAVCNWLDKDVLERYPLSQKLKDTYIKKIQKLEPNYVPPQKIKGGCFIATATMGSYDHPEVMALRNFRDNWILEKNWGESFVKWYYHYGQIAAKSIEKSFILKKICYLLIVKPLYIISKIITTKNKLK
jgi:hypothetical protein